MFSFVLFCGFLFAGLVALASLLVRPVYIHFPRSRPFISRAIGRVISAPAMRRLLLCLILAVAMMTGAGCASHPFLPSETAKEYPINYHLPLRGGKCDYWLIEDVAHRIANSGKFKVLDEREPAGWKIVDARVIDIPTERSADKRNFVVRSLMVFAAQAKQADSFGGNGDNPNSTVGQYRVVLAGSASCGIDGLVTGTLRAATQSRSAIAERKVVRGPYSPAEPENFTVVSVETIQAVVDGLLAGLNEVRR